MLLIKKKLRYISYLLSDPFPEAEAFPFPFLGRPLFPLVVVVPDPEATSLSLLLAGDFVDSPPPRIHLNYEMIYRVRERGGWLFITLVSKVYNVFIIR